MNTQEIVSKLWNLCNVLRDDGITYHQYVTELTYILFLKMAKETGTESKIPEGYRWDDLKEKSGIELKTFYKKLLNDLGEKTTGIVQQIYQGSATNIEEPKNLEKIITTIDGLDWYSAKEEGLGNLYEGLLEKNASEKKSGAGQYFTPRVLIDVMVKLIDPKPGERCNDPAAGTFGFMIAADRYLKEKTDNYFDLDTGLAEFQRTEAFSGCELVHETHRLALMNAMLHDIEGNIILGDTLTNVGKQMKDLDVVLSNPPFGTKKGGERATRDDLTFVTSNKQLNFLQHIYRSLKADGKARAAVVLPDNVLFQEGDGTKIREDLMDKCNLHTILRLPTGIFYAQGVKTNVLFFTRGIEDKGNTKDVWFYDLRTNMPNFGKTNPLKESYFDEFVKAYTAE
ncbi:MAG: N-6 DNA methylase, partial [Clostridium sp.]